MNCWLLTWGSRGPCLESLVFMDGECWVPLLHYQWLLQPTRAWRRRMILQSKVALCWFSVRDDGDDWSCGRKLFLSIMGCPDLVQAVSSASSCLHVCHPAIGFLVVSNVATLSFLQACDLCDVMCCYFTNLQRNELYLWYLFVTISSWLIECPA